MTTLLVISPDYASHYGPLSILAGSARDSGHRVVVATGTQLRGRVRLDGFEWRHLRLGPESNGGVVAETPAIRRFLDATRGGPVDTIVHQARARRRDLLWEPERVARDVARLCDELDPDHVLVDHVSFGSTLAMYATGRDFTTVVPGHPSQLPVGDERYGVPARWPAALDQGEDALRDLCRFVDEVTAEFTSRWNLALSRVAPGRPTVDDATRVHGRRILFNSIASLHDPSRTLLLPPDHRFVGPLVRAERLSDRFAAWAARRSDAPQVYVAFGTFLSQRSDVLAEVAEALRRTGARAALAHGSADPSVLGPIPDDWFVAPVLPQVAMLAHADVAIHHGGNNTVQECLAAGVGQVVVPFSTDQFANAADLESNRLATVLAPNRAGPVDFATAVDRARGLGRSGHPPLDSDQLLDALRTAPIASPS